MNREDVAMDVTVQNVEILRNRVAELEHPEQAEGAHVPDDVFEAEFMTWWEEDGQYCRAGGGGYERTFAFQAWRHLYPKLMRARAALAQPSPKPKPRLVECDACPTSGGCVEVCMKAPVQPSPAPELEQLRYKAELYDEVWELVTGKGYMNVTTAISKLEQERDTAQARVAELEARAFLSVPTDAMLKAYRDVSPSWLCLDGWRAMMEAAPVAQAGQVPEEWRKALEFYAKGDHLSLADPDAWDTCSGEPMNWLHDEAGTASVEDGSLAKQALAAAPAQGGE